MISVCKIEFILSLLTILKRFLTRYICLIFNKKKKKKSKLDLQVKIVLIID